MNRQRRRRLRHWVGAVGRTGGRRRSAAWPVPLGPPIEQIAADLRRLLWQHDALVRQAAGGPWDRRVWSREIGIVYRAEQAARALDLPVQASSDAPGMDRAQLTGLLRRLAAAGLVLPASVALLAPENHC